MVRDPALHRSCCRRSRCVQTTPFSRHRPSGWISLTAETGRSRAGSIVDRSILGSLVVSLPGGLNINTKYSYELSFRIISFLLRAAGAKS